ncbi:discoidin domain-containing protein [Nostocaceae cyanobacterium CENA369]|uniref:Discoidin domain-containing protein n=1 Tax=Dendronalium phyllosphericum CENA369 TaxID=1725256 RepID=A0A8J7LGT2_9NOST|nr:discoidin domain-containing protein [Dendronalium phyllosphericum]MBH8575458.1 discoidin domain-containing protein [Dendronalium phyllosphericum CENA369]
MNLNNFPELSTLTDDCLLLVWDAVTQTTRKVKLSTLKSYLGANASSNNNTFTFQSFGDNKGIFYYLGLNGGTTWSNPVDINKLVISAIGVNNPAIPLTTIVDREQGNFHTTYNNNSWVQFDLIDKKVKLNYWTYRARYDSSYYIPPRLIISGSDDGASFTQLDDKSFSANVNQWVGNAIADQSVAYRYIRFTCPGEIYFTIGEIELYGVLQ